MSLPCCLSQVYKAILRETGQEVAIKVQRPGVEPVILRDLFIFRSMARFINPLCKVGRGLVTGAWQCTEFAQSGKTILGHRRAPSLPPLPGAWGSRDTDGVFHGTWTKAVADLKGVGLFDPPVLVTAGAQLSAWQARPPRLKSGEPWGKQ